MQVTKELVVKDIAQMESNVENFKAQLAQALGALATLKGILIYMEKPEPEPDVPSQQNGPETVLPVETAKVVDAGGKYIDVKPEQV